VKVIIVGSRNYGDFGILIKVINKAYDEEKISITEIVSGGASSGSDKFSEQFAKEANIPITVMKANWGMYSRSAGILRNVAMANSGADALICLWDGLSPGSKHMIDIAKKKGLKLFVCNDKLERLG
jgi:hypothetical protein